jgi:hypothetical protein
MIVKLDRDQARCIQQNFFPYMELLVQNRIDHSSIDQTLNCRLINSIFQEVKLVIDKKLVTTGNQFTIKFSIAQSIVFYQLLMELPINSKEIFLINFRFWICDHLNRWLSEPV